MSYVTMLFQVELKPEATAGELEEAVKTARDALQDAAVRSMVRSDGTLWHLRDIALGLERQANEVADKVRSFALEPPDAP